MTWEIRRGMDMHVYIKDRFSWRPYRPRRTVYITYYRVSQMKRFVRFMEREFKWHNGHFMLKDDKGKPFARFEIYDGKMRVVHKISNRGELYPVWRHF